MKNHYIKNKKGITLVEIVVASALVVLIGTILLNFIFTTIKARDISRQRLDALSIATSYIEEIKSVFPVEGDTFISELPKEIYKDNIKYLIFVNSDILNDHNLIKFTVTVHAPNIDPITVKTLYRGED